MRILSIAAGLAIVAQATATTVRVPGESPLEYCDTDRNDDILNITSIDISPNPPQPGKELTITASVDVKKTVTKGAYIKATVKYGLIQLISTTADLCEQIGNVDLSCPVEVGQVNISKKITLPSAIPPGTYNILADAYSNDDEKITCLKATVNFPGPGQSLEL